MDPPAAKEEEEGEKRGIWANGTSTQRYVRRASQVEPFFESMCNVRASQADASMVSLCTAGRDARQWVTSSGRACLCLLLTSPWAECCEGSAGKAWSQEAGANARGPARPKWRGMRARYCVIRETSELCTTEGEWKIK